MEVSVERRAHWRSCGKEIFLAAWCAYRYEEHGGAGTGICYLII